jgi:hypothetical protein
MRAHSLDHFFGEAMGQSELVRAVVQSNLVFSDSTVAQISSYLFRKSLAGSVQGGIGVASAKGGIAHSKAGFATAL